MRISGEIVLRARACPVRAAALLAADVRFARGKCHSGEPACLICRRRTSRRQRRLWITRPAVKGARRCQVQLLSSRARHNQTTGSHRDPSTAATASRHTAPEWRRAKPRAGLWRAAGPKPVPAQDGRVRQVRRNLFQADIGHHNAMQPDKDALSAVGTRSAVARKKLRQS